MELKKKEERSFQTGKTQRQEDDQNLWHITWRRSGLSGQAEKKQRRRGEIRLEDLWVGGIETSAGSWQDP